jgi:hypothetical protein
MVNNKKGKNIMLEFAKSDQGVEMTIRMAKHSQVGQLNVIVKKHGLQNNHN